MTTTANVPRPRQPGAESAHARLWDVVSAIVEGQPSMTLDDGAKIRCGELDPTAEHPEGCGWGVVAKKDLEPGQLTSPAEIGKVVLWIVGRYGDTNSLVLDPKVEPPAERDYYVEYFLRVFRNYKPNERTSTASKLLTIISTDRNSSRYDGGRLQYTNHVPNRKYL